MQLLVKFLAQLLLQFLVIPLDFGVNACRLDCGVFVDPSGFSVISIVGFCSDNDDLSVFPTAKLVSICNAMNLTWYSYALNLFNKYLSNLKDIPHRKKNDEERKL
jgi:hypothetical protein